MEKSISKSNQCAFPADSRTMTDGGMTLREYYAGLAMSSFFGNESIVSARIPESYVARRCVTMADALIKELVENHIKGKEIEDFS